MTDGWFYDILFFRTWPVTQSALLRCLSLFFQHLQPESAPGQHHHQVIIIQNILPAGARNQDEIII